MNKLALINSLKVVESSGNGGELEYVYVENTPEAVGVLRQIGVPDNDIVEMASDDGDCIDISTFAFTYTDAKYFSSDHGGFVSFIPDDAPEWVKEAFSW